MDPSRSQIARGWKVVDSDGKTVGEVTATREDHIVVSSGTFTKHDLYIPIDELSSAEGDSVAISIPAGKVDEQGWRYPPNAPYARERPAYPEVPETTTMQTAGYSAGRLSAPEPQGAVLDDQTIDPGEVPNADLEPGEQAPGALEETDRT